MGINDWLPTLLTLPALVVAVLVLAKLLAVHRRVRVGSDDHLDVETSRVFTVICALWVVTQATVSLGLWLLPNILGPQVLREGRDRLTFDTRSWLFVAISWLSAVGGLLLNRWLGRQMRHPARPANP